MAEMTKQSDNAYKFYVWFDTEYTSLDLETAWLLQVAALITDTSLQRVLPPEYDVRLNIRLPDDITLSPWVEQNLPDLIKACRSPEAVNIDEADTCLADYVDAAAGSPAGIALPHNCMAALRVLVPIPQRSRNWMVGSKDTTTIEPGGCGLYRDRKG